MGLLHAEGIDFHTTSFDCLFTKPEQSRKQLDACNIIFGSTTLLHDLAELIPVLQKLKRPKNKIVVGGALAGSICHTWDGAPEVDILAIGYGEMLVPALANWIRSDFKLLDPPERGRLQQKQHTTFMYSGVPETASLDFLPTPDRALASRHHQKQYKLIYCQWFTKERFYNHLVFNYFFIKCSFGWHFTSIPR